MKRMLKTILVMLTVLMATLTTHTFATTPIKVLVDQTILQLDQPPALEDGRVLLPIRGIFEALDAEVVWDEATQLLTGEKDGVLIRLEMGKQQALVNGEIIIMDTPGKMINGRTMVPVRFIAENFGIEVTWDPSEQMVIISTDKDEIEDKEEMALYRNTNFKDDYLEINVKEHCAFEIQGKTLSDNQYVLVEVLDGNGNEHFIKQGDIENGEFFEESSQVICNDGTYTINVYMNDKEHGTYQGAHIGIIMSKSKSGLTFENSLVYNSNKDYLSKNNKVSSSDLNLGSFSTKNKKRLLELATSITKDEVADYHKALAVSEWVSENIYYDLDVLETGVFGKTDAIGTLNEERSICQGYAALTSGLLRSIGIPTKQVFGYSLGLEVEGETWDQVNHNNPNHVWNEVYVDDRWIIVDTTWNSKNRYQKGEYIPNDKVYTYFDPTIEAFSNTHKITSR